MPKKTKKRRILPSPDDSDNGGKIASSSSEADLVMVSNTILGGDTYTTLPLVIVYFNILIDKIDGQIFELDRKKDRDEVDESLLLAFQAGRDKMLKHYTKTNWLYCASLVLDPRHKVDTFELTDWGKQMKTQSLQIFHDVFKQYQNDVEENKCKQRTPDFDTDEDEDGITLDMLYGNNKRFTPSEEFQAYASAPRVTKDTNILLWWKMHENNYPNVAKMARDIFSITATSVPSERLFSKAALTIRKHRNRLNTDSARSLLCLNSWMTCKLADQIMS